MPPAEQKAFYLESSRGAFAVRTKPVPKPGQGEVLVRIEAAALNPVDWMIREMGLDWTPYPAVLGYDGAGVVVATGQDVNKFKEGDRMCVYDARRCFGLG